MTTLRDLAMAATPGPWTLDADVFTDDLFLEWCVTTKDHLVSTSQTSVVNGKGAFERAKATQEHHDAAYIAALDPQTVLALLDRIEALEKALPDEPWVWDGVDHWCYACDHEDTSAGVGGPVHEPDCPWLLARAALAAGSGR